MVKLKGKITATMRLKAAQNGISKELLRYRIAKNWDEERATTEPPRSQSPSEKSDTAMLRLAEKNGISTALYRTRVREYKMDEYKAATVPPMSPHQRARLSAEARCGIPAHLVDEAAQNGISYNTLYRRLRVYEPAWDVHRAITTPPLEDRLPKRAIIHRVADDLGIDWRAIRATEVHGNQLYDPVILAIAEVNGIKYDTFVYRMVSSKTNWTELEAATTPVGISQARRVRV